MELSYDYSESGNEKLWHEWEEHSSNSNKIKAATFLLDTGCFIK